MAVIEQVRVPDVGDVDSVTVAEVLVAAGDEVAVDDSLIALESDKASMEVPSPAAGKIVEVRVTVDDEVRHGDVILTLEIAEAAPPEATPAEATPPEATPAEATPAEATAAAPAEQPPPAAETPSPPPAAPAAEAGRATGAQGNNLRLAYASPSVRRLARQLGVDLGRVEGTGRKGRIVKDDVRGYVKKALAGPRAAAGETDVSGFAWPQMPAIDFSKFGEIENRPLSRIRKLSAKNLHRSWLHVAHVTQHDEADVTELEAFRKAHDAEARAKGFKLTPVAFQLKAAAAALRAFPTVNSSLDPSGESLIVKKYCHIGVAVDTPNGLVVPVIRDVDQKGIMELAEELVATSLRARDGKLTPGDFQGASFTITSLGGIGGTAFTPIVNAPEVAILGVSRTQRKPVWQAGGTPEGGCAPGGGQTGHFVPRLMLPLSLSYDHRVIDGALAARFIVHLSSLLGDLRRLLL